MSQASEPGLFSDPLFRQFATSRPIATAVQMVVHRLLRATDVDEIFAQHAEAQYEREQSFSTLTDMVSHVVLGKSPAINAAFKKFSERLGVRINSVYEKLKRVRDADQPRTCPLQLSANRRDSEATRRCPAA